MFKIEEISKKSSFPADVENLRKYRINVESSFN